MVKREDDDVFRIFISHKHEDHELALATKSALQELGGKKKVECFVSGVDIPAGNDWNRVIKEELNRSQLLLLLFTNPTKDWDWCLYEAGLFTRFDRPKVTSVVCIYNPDVVPPAPLKNLQGIPAKSDKLERFLKRLFAETSTVVDDWANHKALNQRVSKEKLKEVAKSISHGFQAAATYHPCHRVVLDLSHIPSKGVGDEIPEQARVVEGPGDTTSFTLSIFGCAPGPQAHTWGELLDNIGGRRELWRTQLDKAFAAAGREALFDPVSATLRSWQQKRLYKPVLYRIVQARESTNGDAGASNRPVQVTIVFEHVYAPAPGKDPLFNLIRTHTRLRIEVFEKFGGRIAELASDGKARSPVSDQVLAALRLIESESAAYGLFDTTNIRAAFGDEKVDEFEKMKAKWMTAREHLDQVLEDSDLTNDEIARVEKLLAEMQTINRTCSIWATQHYLKMLQEDEAT